MATFNDIDALSWPDRIENYRRVIRRAAYVSYEDGWVYGTWFLGNSWVPSAGASAAGCSGVIRLAKFAL
jgi:hypothetical protein